MLPADGTKMKKKIFSDNTTQVMPCRDAAGRDIFYLFFQFFWIPVTRSDRRINCRHPPDIMWRE